ncbi:MAG: DUF1697 domain-containing protein [Paracoccaceae bacterium]
MQADRLPTYVFLLRGIGPATHKIMTMRALEAACVAEGLVQTRSLLATGNLVVTSDLAEDEVETLFTRALAQGGLNLMWQRRTGAAFRASMAALRGMTAFHDAVALRPARVQVHFVPGPVPDAAIARLGAGLPGVRVARAGAEIVIDYGSSISQSGLTLAQIDRALGRGQTARNWNTLCRIETLLCAS